MKKKNKKLEPKMKTSFKQEDFHEGDKVKLNLKNFDWELKTLSSPFVEFLNNNKDTVFTLVKHGSGNILWALEEDPRWTVFWAKLIKV